MSNNYTECFWRCQSYKQRLVLKNVSCVMGMGEKMSKTFKNQNLLIHRESSFFSHDVKVSKEREGEKKREAEHQTKEKYCAVGKTQFRSPSPSQMIITLAKGSHKHSNFRGDSYATEKDPLLTDAI